MTHTFRELVVGGVLLAPFVTYAIAALAIVLIGRPVKRPEANLPAIDCWDHEQRGFSST